MGKHDDNKPIISLARLWQYIIMGVPYYGYVREDENCKRYIEFDISKGVFKIGELEYTTQIGDTLATIIAKFKVTESDLKRWNNLLAVQDNTKIDIISFDKINGKINLIVEEKGWWNNFKEWLRKYDTLNYGYTFTMEGANGHPAFRAKDWGGYRDISEFKDMTFGLDVNRKWKRFYNILNQLGWLSNIVNDNTNVFENQGSGYNQSNNNGTTNRNDTVVQKQYGLYEELVHLESGYIPGTHRDTTWILQDNINPNYASYSDPIRKIRLLRYIGEKHINIRDTAWIMKIIIYYENKIEVERDTTIQNR